MPVQGWVDVRCGRDPSPGRKAVGQRKLLGVSVLLLACAPRRFAAAAAFWGVSKQAASPLVPGGWGGACMRDLSQEGGGWWEGVRLMSLAGCWLWVCKLH